VVNILRILLVLTALVIVGCTQAPPEELSDNRDPYERANRKVFEFNFVVDDVVLEPLAESYLLLPEGTRDSLTNFATWTGYPSTALNSTVQGKFENAALATISFLINGLTLGLADLTASNDKPTSEDFGLTLARWNMPQGDYIVMPFLGPGTARSHTGWVVDSLTNPLGFIEADGADALRTASAPIGIVAFRANNFDQVNDLKYNAPDPYARTRSLYFQYREGQITTPDPEETSSSDRTFDEFFEDDE
jgi:phospholipid-binding lipoprotein MlaA